LTTGELEARALTGRSEVRGRVDFIVEVRREKLL